MKNDKEYGRNIWAIVMPGAAVLIALAAPAMAQITCIWNTANGTFSTAGNWTPSGPPTNTDAAYFQTNITYMVTFDRFETNAHLRVNSGTVTFNLSNNTYSAGLGMGGESIVISNATLIVTNGGQLRTDRLLATTASLTITNNATLRIEGGSKVYNTSGNRATMLADGSWIIVDGAGSEFHELGTDNDLYGDITIQSGGLYQDEAFAWRGLELGANQVWTVSGTGSKIVFAGGIGKGAGVPTTGVLTLNVTNGAELFITNGVGIEVIADSTSTMMTIGGPGATATTVISNQITYPLAIRVGAALVNVNTNGVMRITAGDVSIEDSANYSSILTLNQGTIQMGPGLKVVVENDLGAAVGSPTLRGVGTISRYGSGTNFTISNEGWIKPGDVSSTQALGILTLSDGNLYQTNTAVATAGMYFEFSDTGLDQINLSNGLAQVTAGSNVFALASGAPDPRPQYGLLNYDFIIATNITYSPQYDNLTNLLISTYGLTYGVDFTYSVVNLGGGLQALELKFLPPPGTQILIQ